MGELQAKNQLESARLNADNYQSNEKLKRMAPMTMDTDKGIMEYVPGEGWKPTGYTTPPRVMSDADIAKILHL